MLGIGIRYLTGYVGATDASSYERVEWPPHPGRVFLALAAAHFQSEQAESEEALRWLERQAPPRLIAGGYDARRVVSSFVPTNDVEISPTLQRKLGRGGQAGVAEVKSAAQILPPKRRRAERTFPRAWLHHDTVHVVWREADPTAKVRKALARLCEKVTRIGHSSSLVQVWLCDDSEAEQLLTSDNNAGRQWWEPDALATDGQLRIVGEGCLAYLEAQYREAERKAYAKACEHNETIRRRIEDLESERKAIKGKGSSDRKREIQEQIEELRSTLQELQEPGEPLPVRLSLTHGYSRQRPADVRPKGSVFDHRLVVLRLKPEDTPFRRLELLSTLAVTQAMHKAVIHHAHRVFCGCDRWEGDRPPTTGEAPDCWGKIPASISGHEADGGPTDAAHLAYLPLAFAGSAHADGHLMGIAVALPKCGAINDRRRKDIAGVLEAVCEQGLMLRRLGRWSIDRVRFDELPWRSNLRPEQWTASPERGAKVWASVTPMVFDRHPRAKQREAREAELAEMIGTACRCADLPTPAAVKFGAVSRHLGVPPAGAFSRFTRKDGSRRRQLHATIAFDEPVVGPVLLGAGRFRGYGLFRPVHTKKGR